MYYHADCGHIIDEKPSSPFISERGWRHYTHMYLSDCPICDSKYPYLKQLDNSIRPETEKLVYRLLQAGYQIHIPPFVSPTKSIRLEDVNREDLGIAVDHKRVQDMDQYDTDVLLRVKPE